MAISEKPDSAKVFMSGLSQAVRLPKKFRFPEGCDEVAVRKLGRHLILSPRFANWEDYWANSILPDDDFATTVLQLRTQDLPVEDRESFN